MNDPRSRPNQEQISADAYEFGLHMRQGGWRLGLLVARNVVVAPGRVAPETLAPKVNATEFARRAKTSNDRVLRHYAAWERAANAGLVPHAADLTPGGEVDLDVERLPAWTPIYNAPPERRTLPPRPARTTPAPVTTRPADPITPPTTPTTDTSDGYASRALEAARMRAEQALEELRGDDAEIPPEDRVEARIAEWTEDVRYAINAITGHTRRLFDAARDPEWADDTARQRASVDMIGLSKQLAMIADITADPTKGTVSDQDLAALLTN